MEMIPQYKKGFDALTYGKVPGVWSASSGQDADRNLEIPIGFYWNCEAFMGKYDVKTNQHALFLISRF